MEYTLNKIDDYSRDIYNILTISSTVFKNNRNYFVCAINSLLNNIIIAAITLSLFIITDVDILQHTTFAQIKEMITNICEFYIGRIDVLVAEMKGEVEEAQNKVTQTLANNKLQGTEIHYIFRQDDADLNAI
jgi:hypothetical protein